MNEIELTSLELMEQRLNYRKRGYSNGVSTQQDRMKKDKLKALEQAMLYSYQGAEVRKLGAENTVLALINPNQTKQDYDDKIISINYNAGFAAGTIFEWENTKWLVYLQDLTELAYFKGDVRKCSYEIQWKNGNQTLSTFAAVTGPKESTINTSVNSNISLDMPNHSLNLLIPKTPDTIAYFKRYAEFYLKEDTSVCWRIEGVDSISTPGIIQIAAIEYYKNEYSDEHGIVDAKVDTITPENNSELIQGKNFIKPKTNYLYKYEGEGEAEWTVSDSSLPVILTPKEGNNLELYWDATYSATFDLECNGDKKTIVITSLF